MLQVLSIRGCVDCGENSSCGWCRCCGSGEIIATCREIAMGGFRLCPSLGGGGVIV